jgi:hypothetical protein
LENITDTLISRSTRVKRILSQPVSTTDLVTANEPIDNLIKEGGEDFYNYVNRIGLATDPGLIVLSSIHHYYYDTEELNNARTVINLKELNKIKQIRSFLQSQLPFMPSKCNFLGFFVNNTKVDRYTLRNSSSFLANKMRSDDIENSIVSRFSFINMLYGLMDSKTNTYLSESSVTSLLRDNDFKVLDMTDFNGLTFFHSQKIGHTYN